MRNILKLVFIFILVIYLPLGASAHKGKTDSNGGHIDTSTGEYHYHHGYPAHAHYDMDGDGIIDCPYDFDDQTNHSSGTVSSGVSSNQANGDSYTSGYSDGYRKGSLDGESEGYDAGYTDGEKFGYQTAKSNFDKTLKRVKWTAFVLTTAIVIVLLVIFRRISKKKYLAHRHETDQQVSELKDRVELLRSRINTMTNVQTSLVSSHTKEMQKIQAASAIEIRKIQASHNAEIQKLQSQIKKQQHNDILLQIVRGQDDSIDIPPDIRFRQSFTPIKGKSTSDYPFGDYTIFISDGRKKYHCKHDCSPSAKPMHFFDLQKNVEPCQRCVTKDMYPQPLPDWYYQIREKLDSQS